MKTRGGGCRVTTRTGSVTLSVSQGDGCTLLGPAAPPALTEEPAAPDTDTGSHTDSPNMTRRRVQTRPDGAVTPSQGGKRSGSAPPDLDKHLSAVRRTNNRKKGIVFFSVRCLEVCRPPSLLHGAFLSHNGDLHLHMEQATTPEDNNSSPSYRLNMKTLLRLCHM